MSLVNQMLKDLEQRRGERPAGDSLKGLRASADRSPSRPATGRVAVIGLVVIAAAVAGWTLRPAAEAQISDQVRLAATPTTIATDDNAPVTSVAAITEVVSSQSTSTPTPDTTPARQAYSDSARDADSPQSPSARETAAQIQTVHSDSKPEAHPASLQRRSAPLLATHPAVNESDNDAPPMRKTPRALSPQELADQAYNNALAALARGDTREAEAQLRNALDNWPAHAASAETLAASLVQQGRVDEARLILEGSLVHTPQHAGMAKLQAHLLAEAGRDADALTVLTRAAGAAQQDAQFHALYAALAQRQQQHADAAAAYRRALTLDPRQGAWWMGLGISLEQLRETQLASEAYRKALADTRLTPQIHTYLNGRLAALAQGQG